MNDNLDRYLQLEGNILFFVSNAYNKECISKIVNYLKENKKIDINYYFYPLDKHTKDIKEPHIIFINLHKNYPFSSNFKKKLLNNNIDISKYRIIVDDLLNLDNRIYNLFIPKLDTNYLKTLKKRMKEKNIDYELLNNFYKNINDLIKNKLNNTNFNYRSSDFTININKEDIISKDSTEFINTLNKLKKEYNLQKLDKLIKFLDYWTNYTSKSYIRHLEITQNNINIRYDLNNIKVRYTNFLKELINKLNKLNIIYIDY